MKVTVSTLRVCFSIAVAMALGVSPHSQLANSQEDTADLPGPGLLPGMLQEGEAEKPPMPNVWVEAVFVELDREFTRELEEKAGFGLSPPDGKTLLTTEEKEALLDAIEDIPGARTIASLSVLTVSGQQAQSQDVEQLTYPTEYDTETVTPSASVGALLSGEVFMITPGNWEQRAVGSILNVTPTVLDGDGIGLILAPEVTLLVQWINYGNDIYPIMQPIFRTWNKTTTVIIPDGSTFVLKESPVGPLPRGRQKVPATPMQPKAKRQRIQRAPATTPPTKEKRNENRERMRKKLEMIVPEVTLQDATLKEAIDLLSSQCNVNIVVHPVVFERSGEQVPPPGSKPIPPLEKRDISIRLKNVCLREVLKYLLQHKNLKYIVEDHDILVAPIDYVHPESLETHIFRLATAPVGVIGHRTASASDEPTADAIKDFMSCSGILWPKGSNLAYDRDSGALIVTNTPTNIALIRQILRLWDQPEPQRKPRETEAHKTLLTIISAKIVEGI